MNGCLTRVSGVLALLFLAATAPCQQLTFQRAMQLVFQRGSATTSAADMRHAAAALEEARSYYLPQLMVGSGLGKSFGYPMSIEGAAPSVFQVNYESFLYNPAQREFIRAAREAWRGSEAGMRDQRSATLLEAALDYIQLDSYASRARLLQTQQQQADDLVKIVSQRVQAGVGSDIELKRAQLQAAQVKMRAAETDGAADVLRERLAQLTGQPASAIVTDTESIPDVPDISGEQGLISAAVQNNPAVEAATKQAQSQSLRAKGEHRALLPAVDIVADYGYFVRYNNYDLYFSRFQHNNATVGVAVRFPFLNFPQRARAEEADADAVKADRQVEVAKNQVSNETLRLARSVRQLEAANEVAKLQYDLSQAEAEAIKARVQSAAPGEQGQPAPSPSDLQAAQLQTGDKYAAYLDSSLALQKAKLELLRSAGRLEPWVTGKATP
jgi:outer membrane protein